MPSAAPSISAQHVALWRARRWIAWLPAMAIGPAMLYLASTCIETASRWRFVQRHPASPLSMEWSAFAFNIAAPILGFAAIALVAWIMLRVTPRMVRSTHINTWVSSVKLVGIVAFIFAMFYYILIPVFAIALRFIEPIPDSPRGNARIAISLSAHVGTILIAIWLVRWQGRGVRCARCGYDMPTRYKSPPNCPECNNAWKRLGGTTYGHRLPIWLPILGLVIYLGATIIGAAII